MATRTKFVRRKLEKGQEDHVDSWLMSYADMITLLCMLFIVLVSYSLMKPGDTDLMTRGEAVHPDGDHRAGFLPHKTHHEAVYRELTGLVITHNADREIAVEKTPAGIRIDLSALTFFKSGSAEISQEELPLVRLIARTIRNGALASDTIEVEGYTDDEIPRDSMFSSNWELSAVRATRVVELLISEGVDPARLRAISYAANRPIVPNYDALGNPITENRERNQRVVIRVEAIPVEEPKNPAKASKP